MVGRNQSCVWMFISVDGRNQGCVLVVISVGGRNQDCVWVVISVGGGIRAVRVCSHLGGRQESGVCMCAGDHLGGREE